MPAYADAVLAADADAHRSELALADAAAPYVVWARGEPVTPAAAVLDPGLGPDRRWWEPAPPYAWGPFDPARPSRDPPVVAWMRATGRAHPGPGLHPLPPVWPAPGGGFMVRCFAEPDEMAEDPVVGFAHLWLRHLPFAYIWRMALVSTAWADAASTLGARRAALQWRHFAYARHGVPCLELARAELRPTPAPPVPTAEEVAEAAAAEAAEAAWEEARAARQMEADLRLSREWLLGLDDDCVDDDYR